MNGSTPTAPPPGPLVGIGPSVVCADRSNLSRALTAVHDLVDWWHFDAADDTIGDPSWLTQEHADQVLSLFDLDLDLHLLSSDPLRLVADWDLARFSAVTVHAEYEPPDGSVVDAVRRAGASVGVAVMADTDLSLLAEWEAVADSVLLLCVPPGSTGAHVDSAMADRLATVRNRYPGCCRRLVVDGGIKPHNAPAALAAGATGAVVGSGIFAAAEPRLAAEALHHDAWTASRARPADVNGGSR